MRNRELFQGYRGLPDRRPVGERVICRKAALTPKGDVVRDAQTFCEANPSNITYPPYALPPAIRLGPWAKIHKPFRPARLHKNGSPRAAGPRPFEGNDSQIRQKPPASYAISAASGPHRHGALPLNSSRARNSCPQCAGNTDTGSRVCPCQNSRERIFAGRGGPETTRSATRQGRLSPAAGPGSPGVEAPAGRKIISRPSVRTFLGIARHHPASSRGVHNVSQRAEAAFAGARGLALPRPRYRADCARNGFDHARQTELPNWLVIACVSETGIFEGRPRRLVEAHKRAHFSRGRVRRARVLPVYPPVNQDSERLCNSGQRALRATLPRPQARAKARSRAARVLGGIVLHDERPQGDRVRMNFGFTRPVLHRYSACPAPSRCRLITVQDALSIWPAIQAREGHVQLVPNCEVAIPHGKTAIRSRCPVLPAHSPSRFDHSRRGEHDSQVQRKVRRISSEVRPYVRWFTKILHVFIKENASSGGA